MVFEYSSLIARSNQLINTDTHLIDKFFTKQSNRVSMLHEIIQLTCQIQSLQLELALNQKDQVHDDFTLLLNQYLRLLTTIEQLDTTDHHIEGSTSDCPSTAATLVDLPSTADHSVHHHTTPTLSQSQSPPPLKPTTNTFFLTGTGEKSRDFLREDYLYPFHKRISDPTKPRILLSKSRNYLPFGMTRDEIERAREVWWFPNKPPKHHHQSPPSPQKKLQKKWW